MTINELYTHRKLKGWMGCDGMHGLVDGHTDHNQRKLYFSLRSFLSSRMDSTQQIFLLRERSHSQTEDQQKKPRRRDGEREREPTMDTRHFGMHERKNGRENNKNARREGRERGVARIKWWQQWNLVPLCSCSSSTSIRHPSSLIEPSTFIFSTLLSSSSPSQYLHSPSFLYSRLLSCPPPNLLSNDPKSLLSAQA